MSADTFEPHRAWHPVAIVVNRKADERPASEPPSCCGGVTAAVIQPAMDLREANTARFWRSASAERRVGSASNGPDRRTRITPANAVRARGGGWSRDAHRRRLPGGMPRADFRYPMRR